MQSLQYAITALCLGSALWLVALIVRDHTPGPRFLNVLLGLEVLLLVHLVVGIVRVVSEAKVDVAEWEYIGYLVGSLLFVPAGVIWSSGERSRGGTGVLLVAVLLVPFMFLRLADIWAVGG